MPAANSQHESNNWVGQREHTNKKSIQLSILSVNEIVYISWAGWSCPPLNSLISVCTTAVNACQ